MRERLDNNCIAEPILMDLYKAFGRIPHDLIVATSATTTNVKQRLKLTRNQKVVNNAFV